jgi:SAM-dependent methyltransferase
MESILLHKKIRSQVITLLKKLSIFWKNKLSSVHHYFLPLENAVYDQTIESDLKENKMFLKGKVLNAGAGWRDLSYLVDGQLINQDIYYPEETRNNISIYSPLHIIPVNDHFFDTIVCIGVLEHTENPEEIMKEFYRVLKPHGHLILDIPFLQPEHLCPTDFQRYTKDGMIKLANRHGFSILSIKGRFNVYHTLYWIVWIWLHQKNSLLYLILRILLLRPLIIASKYSKTYTDKLASCFQLLAVKN